VILCNFAKRSRQRLSITVMLRSLNKVLAIAFQPSLASGCLNSKVVIRGTGSRYYAWMRTGRSLPVLQLPATLACGTQDLPVASLFSVCTAASGSSDKAQQVCKCSAGETCAACCLAAHAIFSAGFNVVPKDSGRHDLACQAAPAMKVGTVRRRAVGWGLALSLGTPVRLPQDKRVPPSAFTQAACSLQAFGNRVAT